MLRKGNAQVRFIMVREKAENDWALWGLKGPFRIGFLLLAD